MKFERLKKFALRHKEKIFFLLVSLLIVGPLLKPGFVLTLDMIFTPNMTFVFPPVSGVYNQVPLDGILYIISKIIPADVLQKVILVGIFYFIPAIFHKFLSLFGKKQTSLVKIAASILYLFNPFVYSRFMAGHWTFLVGYALLPLIVYHVYKFLTYDKLDKEFYKQLLLLNLTAIVSVIFSVHHFFFLLIIFAIASIVTIIQKQKNVPRKILLLFLPFLAVNLFWIIPTITAEKFHSFGNDELQLFATSPDESLGVIGNLLTFYGFWAEKTLFLLPKTSVPFWPLTFFFLYIPAVLSFLVISIYKKGFKKLLGNPILIALIILSVIGFILSFGSFSIGKIIFEILYIKFPLLGAFREPQKFLSLFIFAFSILFYLGLKFWSEEMEREKLDQIKGLSPKEEKKILSILSKIIPFGYIILIFALTYQLFWGGFGQLKSVAYPDSWSELQKTAEAKESILVLPYQSYATFEFNNRRIANPAPEYFDSRVVSKQTLDETEDNLRRCDVAFEDGVCLMSYNSSVVWSETLKKESVDYVLLNKNDDWGSYKIVLVEPQFSVITRDEFSYVFKVN